jgi:hypothetical protein
MRWYRIRIAVLVVMTAGLYRTVNEYRHRLSGLYHCGRISTGSVGSVAFRSRSPESGAPSPTCVPIMMDTDSPIAKSQATTATKSSEVALRVTPHLEINRRAVKTVARAMRTRVTKKTVGPRLLRTSIWGEPSTVRWMGQGASMALRWPSWIAVKNRGDVHVETSWDL